MTLSYEDKVQLYELRQNGERLTPYQKSLVLLRLISNICFD